MTGPTQDKRPEASRADAADPPTPADPDNAAGGGDDAAEWTPAPIAPLPPPPPVPPEALKPWYYQSWFIVPTFVWWPCSAILFIRSPWHNGVVSGALSWAWLIIGGGWIFLRTQLRLRNGEGLLDDHTLFALAAPGVLLTVITQSLWLLRDRPRIRRLRAAGRFADYDDGNAGNTDGDNAARRRETAEPASGVRRRANRGGVRSRRRRR